MKNKKLLVAALSISFVLSSQAVHAAEETKTDTEYVANSGQASTGADSAETKRVDEGETDATKKDQGEEANQLPTANDQKPKASENKALTSPAKDKSQGSQRQNTPALNIQPRSVNSPSSSSQDTVSITVSLSVELTGLNEEEDFNKDLLPDTIKADIVYIGADLVEHRFPIEFSKEDLGGDFKISMPKDAANASFTIEFTNLGKTTRTSGFSSTKPVAGKLKFTGTMEQYANPTIKLGVKNPYGRDEERKDSGEIKGKLNFAGSDNAVDDNLDASDKTLDFSFPKGTTEVDVDKADDPSDQDTNRAELLYPGHNPHLTIDGEAESKVKIGDVEYEVTEKKYDAINGGSILLKTTDPILRPQDGDKTPEGYVRVNFKRGEGVETFPEYSLDVKPGTELPKDKYPTQALKAVDGYRDAKWSVEPGTKITGPTDIYGSATEKDNHAFEPKTKTVFTKVTIKPDEDKIKKAVSVPGYKKDFTVTIDNPAQIVAKDKEESYTVDVTVKYADGTEDKAQVTVQVVPPINQDYEPTTKEIETTVGVVPDAKDGIANKSTDTVQEGVKKLPENATFEWVEKPDVSVGTKEGKEVKGKVQVTYPDNSHDVVEVTVKVKDTKDDNQKYTAQGGTINKKFGEKTTEEEIKKAVTIPGFPTGGTQPELTVNAGQKIPDGTKNETAQIKVTVKYPDNSTQEVEVTVIVGEDTRTDAQKNDPQPVSNPLETVVGKVPEAKKGIANYDDLQNVEKIVWLTEPDVSKVADKVTGTALVVYKDGTFDKVEVPVKVVDKADTTAPKIEKIGDQTVVEKQPIKEIEVKTDDPEAEITVEGLPNGVTYDKDSKKITGSPEIKDWNDTDKEHPEEVREVKVTVKAKDKAGNESEEHFTITVQRDTDGDGIPDIYDKDDDGDGVDDEKEKEKGTDPKDPNSKPAITKVDTSKVKPVDPTDEKQGTGVIVENPDKDTKVSAKDEDGKDIPVVINDKTGEIEVTPGEKVDGPINVVVEDPDLPGGKVNVEVPVNGHEKGRDDNKDGHPGEGDTYITGKVTPVDPTDEEQKTGLVVKNADKDTEVSAKDEDGKDIPVRIDENGNIVVTPGTKVDGPIKVTVKDKDLPNGEQTFDVPVKGHEAGRDDNHTDTRINDKNKKPVNPTNEKQGTGVIVENADKDTKVSAKDEDGKDIQVVINDKTGEIEVTPGTDVDGPITVTVEDKDLDGGKADIEIEVKDHKKGQDDNGSDKKIADKVDPTVPKKTGVKDPNKLTDKEKKEVEDKVNDANKDKFPEGTKVVVDDKGKATITYPDESTDTIPAEDLIFQYKKGDALIEDRPEMPISDLIDPTIPKTTEVKDKDKLTDEEKGKVKKAVEDANKDKFPEGTKVDVDDKGKATITYPDCSKDTIPADKLVKQADKKVELTEAEKNVVVTPKDKTGVVDKNNLTDKERKEVAEKVKKVNPAVVEVQVDKKGNATLIYSDGSENTIPADKLIYQLGKQVAVPGKNAKASAKSGKDSKKSTNVKTGVGSLSGVFATIAAAASALFATKKKEDEE